jgi:hypothetical protein
MKSKTFLIKLPVYILFVMTILPIFLGLNCTKNNSDSTCTMTADTTTANYAGAILYSASTGGSGNKVTQITYNSDVGPTSANPDSLPWSKEVKINAGELIGISGTGIVKEASVAVAYFYTFSSGQGSTGSILVTQQCGSGNPGHTLPYNLTLQTSVGSSNSDGYIEYVAGFTDSSKVGAGDIESLSISYAIAPGVNGLQTVNNVPSLPYYNKIQASAGTPGVIRVSGYFNHVAKFFVTVHYYDSNGTLVGTNTAYE